jgi:hypothetical protein
VQSQVITQSGESIPDRSDCEANAEQTIGVKLLLLICVNVYLFVAGKNTQQITDENKSNGEQRTSMQCIVQQINVVQN